MGLGAGRGAGVVGVVRGMTDEIARLRVDLLNAHRIIWCLARQAGGEVRVTQWAMEEATRSGATLENTPSLDGMSMIVRAKETADGQRS